MKDEIPVIYWTFRAAWTVVHLLVFFAALAVLLSWALTDDTAVRLFESAKLEVLELQEKISHLVPWFWES